MGVNCRAAFQEAFNRLAGTHGGTLILPYGTLELDFLEIQNNVQSSHALARESLIVVPQGVKIVGHITSDVRPVTNIVWSVTSIPVFVFASASHSSMENVHFHFTGTTPEYFPYGDIALLNALGYKTKFPHDNQMSGGNYEMFSAIYALNSEYCKFDNLIFDSAIQSNDNALGFGINLKGKNIYIAPNAGGMTGLSAGNEISRIRLYDYIMGLMISGQQDLRIQGVIADRRASTMSIAPGHLIYVASEIAHEADGQTQLFLNKGISIENVFEGPNTYSNIHSGGTFALKYIDGGLVSRIESHHPLGILQTLNADKNVVFRDLAWQSDYDLCENVPSNCGLGVINATETDTDPQFENLSFENISLSAAHEPISALIMGQHISIKNILIETLPTFLPGQTNTNSLFSIKRADDVALLNYHYTPVISSFNDKEHYNAPFAAWIPSRNIHAVVDIILPETVQFPPAGSRLITPILQNQDKDPANKIDVETRVTWNKHALKDVQPVHVIGRESGVALGE